MELILVRHGIAEDPEAARSDEERRLTAEGKEKAIRIAKALRKRVDKIKIIYHSPFLRAVETAALFAKEFGDAELEIVERITPHHGPGAVLKLLETHGPEDVVMIVGHEPHLSSLASLLMTGSEAPVLEFKKAGVACLESWNGKNRFRLKYLISPGWL